MFHDADRHAPVLSCRVAAAAPYRGREAARVRAGTAVQLPVLMRVCRVGPTVAGTLAVDAGPGIAAAMWMPVTDSEPCLHRYYRLGHPIQYA